MNRPRIVRQVLATTALMAALFGVAMPGNAVSPTLVTLSTPTTNPFSKTISTTASLSAFNFVTVRGNLSRRWFNNTGLGTNDITNNGQPPFSHSLVVWCNDTFANPKVQGPVTGNANATPALAQSCQTNQPGSASQHNASAN
jgi:hypothetical protein